MCVQLDLQTQHSVEVTELGWTRQRSSCSVVLLSCLVWAGSQCSSSSGLSFVSKGAAEQDPWSGCAAFEDTAGWAHLWPDGGEEEEQVWTDVSFQDLHPCCMCSWCAFHQKIVICGNLCYRKFLRNFHPQGLHSWHNSRLTFLFLKMDMFTSRQSPAIDV